MPGTHHTPTPVLLIRACWFAGCPRSTWRPTAAPRSPAPRSPAPYSSAPPSSAPVLAGISLVGASLVGASLHVGASLARRHLAHRLLARRHLARRCLTRWCLGRQCLAPNHPGRPLVRQPGQATVAHGHACVCHLAVRARRPWAARMCGCTHGTPGPGIPCRGSREYVLFLLQFAISAAISSSGPRNSRNSSSYFSYFSHVSSRNSRNSEPHYSWSYFSD